jgi:hypothetical protein
MTNSAIRIAPGFRLWPLLASLLIAFAAIFGAKTANAQNFQLAPNVLQQLGPLQAELQPNRTVTIQGGGLMFLDAHEIAERDYNVVIRSFQNNGTQQWVLINVYGNTYRIMQASSGRYLDAHEIAEMDFRVVTRPYQDNNTQLWNLQNYGGGFYTIQQVSSGRFIQPYLDEAHDFQVVTRTAPSDQQTWRIGSP